MAWLRDGAEGLGNGQRPNQAGTSQSAELASPADTKIETELEISTVAEGNTGNGFANGVCMLRAVTSDFDEMDPMQTWEYWVMLRRRSIYADEVRERTEVERFVRESSTKFATRIVIGIGNHACYEGVAHAIGIVGIAAQLAVTVKQR